MTTTPNPSPLDFTDESRAALADAIINLIGTATNEDDALSDLIFDAMIDDEKIDLIFAPAMRDRFLLAFDCCPIHRTDLDSCADDELPECAHLRTQPRDDR
jgi:hypothetical protein